MGVMRCLGLKSNRVIYILLLQSATYALPSWIFALIVSQIIAAVILTGNLKILRYR